MHRPILAVILIMLCSPVFAAAPPKTEVEKTLYAVGLTVARQLAVFSLTPAELEIVQQGIVDGATGGKPEIELGAYSEKVQELARARMKAQAEKKAPQNREFLEKAAMEKGAQKTDSGLIYLSLNEGSGSSPMPTDMVKVNYRGTLPDGKEFDSSYKRGAPAEFRLDGVIACWKEGLQKMKPGGKARLVCPAALAYGETGVGAVIPPGSPLAFEVELIEIKKHN